MSSLIGVAPATALPQRARGLNIGAGWRGQTRRWDLGVIGAGFDRPNLVGSWRESVDLAGLDATLEISRRVLTGSLLSYAATRDPVSGRRWGGVTLNAASLRLARYGEGWGVSANLLAGLLKGNNVAGNSTQQLRLAADRDWHDSTALRVNALSRHDCTNPSFTYGPSSTSSQPVTRRPRVATCAAMRCMNQLCSSSSLAKPSRFITA